MTIMNLISLGGGVALFLYGMTVMGSGLEKLSGGKLESALASMTNNIYTSVALGAVVTGLIQSSSATTVIVVGLVNAGILQLRQAVGVIMGANIGTTVTAQLIRLSDIQSDNIFLLLLKPATLAPVAAIVGILLYMMSRRNRKKELGQMLIGFGILFSGMFTMEAAMKPLQSSTEFANIVCAMSNPILGVLAGALITAAIQSSSASVGMLQALASTGVLPFSTAFSIIMGQNIGTCITPILSSIGASKNAKRSALIHLYFNIVGTIVFISVVYIGILIFGQPSFWGHAASRTSIANFHTFFNVTVTLLFIPFHGLLVKMARMSIKDPKESKEDELKILDERFLQSPSLALQQSGVVLRRMHDIAQQNYRNSVLLMNSYDVRLIERIKEEEAILDRMEDKLEHYLVKLSSNQISTKESHQISIFLRIIKDYERIGDYAINLVESAENMHENKVVFSALAVEEVSILYNAIDEILTAANKAFDKMDTNLAKNIEPLEETVDAVVELLKNRHVERLKEGACNIHAGIIFLEILTNLERIADHCSNIGIHVLHLASDERYDAHEYIRRTHEATDAQYVEQFEGFMKQYYEQVEKLTGTSC